MKRKCLLLSLVFSLFLTSVSFAAQGDYLKLDDTIKSEHLSDLGRLEVKDGKFLYVIDDQAQIAEELMKDDFIVPEGKQVTQIITYYSEPKINRNVIFNSFESNSIPIDVTPQCSIGCYTSWSVENVVDQGNTWYFASEEITNSYQGPTEDSKMQVNIQKQARWSSDFSISTSAVEAGVGFDFSQSISVTGEYVFDVPAGYTAYVSAWPYYSKKTFDIYQNVYALFIRVQHYDVGDGQAYNPTGGVRFRQYLMKDL